MSTSAPDNLEHELSAYLDDELEPVRRAAVEDYLRRSEAGRTTLAELTRVRAGLGNLPRAAAPATLRADVLRQFESAGRAAVGRGAAGRAARPTLLWAGLGTLASAAALALAVGIYWSVGVVEQSSPAPSRAVEAQPEALKEATRQQLQPPLPSMTVATGRAAREMTPPETNARDAEGEQPVTLVVFARDVNEFETLSQVLTQAQTAPAPPPADLFRAQRGDDAKDDGLPAAFDFNLDAAQLPAVLETFAAAGGAPEGALATARTESKEKKPAEEVAGEPTAARQIGGGAAPAPATSKAELDEAAADKDSSATESPRAVPGRGRKTAAGKGPPAVAPSEKRAGASADNSGPALEELPPALRDFLSQLLAAQVAPDERGKRLVRVRLLLREEAPARPVTSQPPR